MERLSALDEQNKTEQREIAKAGSETFSQTLQAAGMSEYMLLSCAPNGDGSYEVFARINGTLLAAANMIGFSLLQMDDDACAKILNWLLQQPSIMAKMAAYQSHVMAEHAEKLRQQAAQQAPPKPELTITEVPAAETKKEWMN